MPITDTAKEFVTKYNHLTHTVEIYLDNTNGDSTSNRFYINPNSIINLTIENDLSDWVTRGVLSFYFNPAAHTGVINEKTGQANGSARSVE